MGTTKHTLQELELKHQRDLEDARLLHTISTRRIHEQNESELYQEIMTAATAIMGSDIATMQMYYPERGTHGELRMIASHGLDAESLKFWEWVRADSKCTCGHALATRERCIIEDVEESDLLRGTPDLDAFRKAGMKALHSTPLITRTGEILGMISTHWKRTHQPQERDLLLFDILARQAADLLYMRRAETAMHNAQNYLASIVTSSGDAIISKDLNGKVTSWNGAAERVFGYAAHEMIGQSITKLIPEEQLQEEEQILTTLRTGKMIEHFETTRRHKLGHMIPVSLTVSPIRDATGNIIGASKISRDITAQKKLEMDARAAQERAEAANMAKTEFLATMSHEIRTPMNAVIGLSNILGMSKPLSEKQREYIKTLRMSADSLLSLINDLLDIAKIESHTVEMEHIPFSIEQLAEETISMMNVRVKEKGLTFNVVQDCARIANRLIIGDPTRVRQILLNLCSNAIKFTEQGGIELHISCAHEPVSGKELVCMAVTDTGIGIQAEKMGDIFQKFTQADSSISRKFGGTGLGLAITKTLTEMMGGHVELTSEFGKGSTFSVTIPFEMADGHDVLPMVKAAPGSETPAVSRHARVLLVEDYEPNVLVASTFLEGFGYEVDVASNGFEAIEKIKQTNYMAALMDVQMHGMNGLEATQSIRTFEKLQHKPRVYIIGMTAHALVGDRERCLAAGMDDYIAKPFNPDKLEEMLAQLAVKSLAA